MSKIIKSGLLFFFCIFTAINSFAYDEGGMPGYFLDQGMGIRALGMGKAYVSVSDDVSSIYWNPAGLVKIKRNEITAGYIRLFEDTRYNYLGLTDELPLKLFFGLGFMQLASFDIEKRDIYNNPGGMTDDYHNAYMVSLGRRLGDNLSIGITYKMINNKFDDIESWGNGADLSFLYSFYQDKLSLGLNIQNILRPELKKSSGNYLLPINLKTGMSWLLNKNMILAFDMDKTADTGMKIHAGTEYKLSFLSLRAGYDTDNVTAGFGLKIKDYQFDYAIIKHALDYSHRGGITFSFGELKEEKTVEEQHQEPQTQTQTTAEQIEVVKSTETKEAQVEEMLRSELMEKNYSVTIRTAESIPTAIYDLLEKNGFSVINLLIENKSDKPATFKVTYQIDGKSNEESKIIVIRAKAMVEVNCYPTLLPEVIRNIHLHTPANIKVGVYNIDETGKLEWVAEKTSKTTLNPYDQFCLKLTDAKGIEFDLLSTIISWITFNDRKLNEVLSKATEQGSMLIPPIKIIGDQPPYIFTKMLDDKRTLLEKDIDYIKQIKLIYNTLKDEYKLSYLNQPIVYRACQRIKFPAVTLKEKGNCIELSVLFASLLESIEIEPVLALFLEDGHAAVGWKVRKDEEEIYHLLEPNVFGEDFDRLLERGKEMIISSGLETEFKQGIPFPEDGIYRKGTNIILMDVKKIRNRIPPSPYISQ